MLRITIHDADAITTIKLQGKLAAGWVAEVLKAWTELATSGQTVSLDLSQVSYVDKAGRSLLTDMHARGVKLVGPGLTIRGLLDEITSR